MRALAFALLTVATLAVPAALPAQTRELRDDRRELREARRELREDRRDFREDQRKDRFHAGRYYAPRGYVYRGYAPGAYFPRHYYAQRYWIGDPVAYRLPPVPYRGLRWVRYGPDAVLIRIGDGVVIRTLRGRFY